MAALLCWLQVHESCYSTQNHHKSCDSKSVSCDLTIPLVMCLESCYTQLTLSCATVTSARKMHRQSHSCMPLPPTYQQVWTAFRSTGPHSSRTTFVLNCSLSASMDGPTKATSRETFAVLASERGTCGKSLFPFMMTYHSMDTASCYHWACKRKHFRRSMVDIKAFSNVALVCLHLSGGLMSPNRWST